MLISNMAIAFLKFRLKNTNKAFLVTDLAIFIFFLKILLIHKFEGADFKWQYYFQIGRLWEFSWRNFEMREIRGTRKYPNKPFFVVNVSIFYFCMKLHILKNLKTLISKMAIVFFQSHPNNTQIPNFIWKLKFLFTCKSEWTQFYF